MYEYAAKILSVHDGDTCTALVDLGFRVAIEMPLRAVPGNDYCNGNIAVIQSPNDYACMCDCLHIDDVAAMLSEKGLDKRPDGK